MTQQAGFMAHAGRRFAIALAVWVGLSAAAEQAVFASVATIELATVATPGSSDTASTLPVSQTVFAPGATLFVEVWAQTTQGNGLSSASADIAFNSGLLHVVGVTHTVLFGALTHAVIDNVNGVVDDLSGSHLAPCSGAVGFVPNWARVAVLEVHATNVGTTTIQSRQTSSLVYGTAICGLGDVPSSQISFQSRTITITSAEIPTISTWGMVLLALALSIAATAVLHRRSPGVRTLRRSFPLRQD